MATAAIRSLKHKYGDRFRVSVQTSCDAIFENNPDVVPWDGSGETHVLEYPLIHQSDRIPCHFLQGFCDDLAAKLGVPVPLCTNHGHLYLSADEQSWTNQVEEQTGYAGPFWLINAGVKRDYTVKGWGLAQYQAVVDALHPKVQFVQVGAREHNHPGLKNVIDFRGKTDHRQFIRLCYHAVGAVTGESYLHHLMGAFRKPCVTICSGFLAPSWVSYPTGRIVTRFGCLPCCAGKSCGKARVVKLDDGDKKDKSLCKLPVVMHGEFVPKCMALIPPEEVVQEIKSYYWGGVAINSGTVAMYPGFRVTLE